MTVGALAFQKIALGILVAGRGVIPGR